MPDLNLRDVITEISKDLEFLPESTISELIADMIEEVLPDSILQTKDVWKASEYKDIPRSEYLERRKGGKQIQEINEELLRRREVLNEIWKSKSELINLKTNNSALTMISMRDATTNWSINTSLPEVENQQVLHSNSNILSSLENSSPNIRKPRGSNLTYIVDDSLLEKIRSDALYRKFSSTIEETARLFASVHKNRMIFNLKERKDTELPNWKRTILLIQLCDLSFDEGSKLWLVISDETRIKLKDVLKRLTAVDKSRFQEFMLTFNIEMDF